MPQNLYEAVWIFFIYAFLGWCVEVVYATVCHGKFVNRGFLNGPVCPIYGVGMLVCVMCLWNLRRNPFLLFLGSFVFTTGIEYITGLILEKIFHTKWWDYTDMPFNLKGYVCLAFSILWGLAATFIIGAIHPFIMFVITRAPRIIGYILLFAVSAGFVVDIVLTVQALLKLPKQLKIARDLEKLLNDVSEDIGENLSEKTLKAAEKFAEQKPKIEEKRAEYKRLYDQRRNRITRRIAKAFPNLKEGKYKEVFERIKKKKR